MDEDGVRALLSTRCKEAGGVAPWADGHGVSSTYARDVIAGRRPPGEAILRALGLERVVTYRKTGRTGDG